MKVKPFVIVLVFALALPPLSRAQQSGQATLCDNESSTVAITSDTQGINFGPYLHTLTHHIRESWHLLIPDDARPPQNKRGCVVIEFKILKDGHVEGAGYRSSSGDQALDNAAFQAITVTTLPPLPTEYKGESINVRIRFLYNPPREAANEAEPPRSSGDALTYPLAPLVASDQGPSISASANPSGPTAEEIRLGTPVHTIDPIVPKGLHGKSAAAILGATMQMDGTLADLSALGGDQGFEETALDAVHQWRYTSATLNGKPVEAKVFIVFLLRHGEIKTSIEPDLPYPTKPRKPIEEQRASGELFGVVVDHVKPPKPIYEPNPDYSEPARAAKYQGTVVLGLIVGRDGTPADVWVVRKLGLGLDQKAVQAVRQWRFEPGLKDGEPVSVFANVEVGFHLY